MRIKRLTLSRFKNFKEATLICGPLTLLMGTNASGKSNVRDALRFLHGIGRGYKLAEIFGEKYENGTLQWHGVRGGIAETAYLGAETFGLALTFEASNPEQPMLIPRAYRYDVEVEPMHPGRPKVLREALYADREMLFDTDTQAEQVDSQHIKINIRPGGNCRKGHTHLFISDQPVLSQILAEEGFDRRDDEAADEVRHGVHAALRTLRAMRFLDLTPAAMCNPAFPGQPLGDRGENLSAVLLDIYEKEGHKRVLTEWIRALTPMDVQDFKFPSDQVGRVLVSLVEEQGHEISAYSASDGTLRFLAIAAALLGGEAPRFYFFEELENGIHPTRLHLLLDLIEQHVARRGNQVIATTHSPQLLRLVSPQTLEHTSLIYRADRRHPADKRHPAENELAGHIRRLMDLLEPAQQTLKTRDLARLYESGWFEDTISFLTEEADDRASVKT